MFAAKNDFFVTAMDFKVNENGLVAIAFTIFDLQTKRIHEQYAGYVKGNEPEGFEARNYDAFDTLGEMEEHFYQLYHEYKTSSYFLVKSINGSINHFVQGISNPVNSEFTGIPTRILDLTSIFVALDKDPVEELKYLDGSHGIPVLLGNTVAIGKAFLYARSK